jgi:hypothetical protein
MAGNELKITGLKELSEALKQLPADLVQEGGEIVRSTTSMMAQDVLARYPTTGTGALARGVKLETRSDAVSAVGIVRNTARHAYIFDRGTGPRRWKKNNKNTGSMPKGAVFKTLAPVHRRRMNSQLIDLVERAGFKVTGSAT